MSVLALRGAAPSANHGGEDGEGLPWWAIVLLAALVEGALLFGATTFLRHPPAPPAHLPPMQIVLEAPPPPKPAVQPKVQPKIQPKPAPHIAPPQPRPHVQPHPKKLRPVKPHRAPPPPPRPAPVVAPPPQPAPEPVPLPAPPVVAPPPVAKTIPAMPVAPPAPPVIAAPVVDLQALRAAYGQSMHTAIQAAARYPEMARRMGETGRVQVAFRYENGAVHDLHVLSSSGSGVLDRAAERAVRSATYPALPAALHGKPLELQVWITFSLDGAAD